MLYLFKICDYDKANFVFKSPIIDPKLMAIMNNNIFYFLKKAKHVDLVLTRNTECSQLG